MTSKHIPAEILIQIAHNLTPGFEDSLKARRLAKTALANLSLASKTCCEIARPLLFNSLHTLGQSWLDKIAAVQQSDAKHLLEHVKCLKMYDMPNASKNPGPQYDQLYRSASIVKSFLFELKSLKVLLLKCSDGSAMLKAEIEADKVHYSIVNRSSHPIHCERLEFSVSFLFLAVSMIVECGRPDEGPNMCTEANAFRWRVMETCGHPELWAWRWTVPRITSTFPNPNYTWLL